MLLCLLCSRCFIIEYNCLARTGRSWLEPHGFSATNASKKGFSNCIVGHVFHQGPKWWSVHPEGTRKSGCWKPVVCRVCKINPLPSDKFNNNHIDLFRFFTKFDVFITVRGSWGSSLNRDICLWVRIPAFFPLCCRLEPAKCLRSQGCPRQLWSMSMSIQRLNTGMSPNGSKILVRREYHSTKAIRPIRSSNHTDSQGHNLRISSKNKGPFFLGNPVLIASLLKKSTPTPTAYPTNCRVWYPPKATSWASNLLSFMKVGPPSKVELQINESVGVSSGPSRRRRSQPTALPSCWP